LINVACSVPPSDASDTDDHDSVHSLPVGSTRKREKEARSVSSGHTPQASYADIARHAAALYTQQAGQQQTAVYREALQCRETTPASSGNNKESVSSAEGDSISFHYSSTSAHTGPDEHHAHTLTRAASEPSDSYRPPLTAPERSPLLPAAPPSQQLQSPPSSKERRTAAPPTSSAPPVVILDTTSTTVSPPVQGFTFGFEVNEDLLKENVGEEKEERLLDQDSNGDTGAVIPQNSVKDNDNVMMKNLLSLTSKSQDNDSNRSSEPLKSETEDEVEEEEEEERACEEKRELRKDKGICLDFSTFHEEEIDVNKFNYDVILGFVSKAWEMVNMELKTGSPTIYYSS
jgi:hypothetical protein